ncbi:MAG: hypothetical protein AAF614_07985 [Chloroflexota bacterium]
MATKESSEQTHKINVEQRLKHLELQASYQELEKRLAREEGHRSGVKTTIEVVAITLTILVTVGIATLWLNVKQFQKSTQENIEATIQSNIIVRETAIKMTVDSMQEAFDLEVNAMVSDIGTRTINQVSTQDADVARRASREMNALADIASTQTAELSGTAQSHNRAVLRQSEYISTRAPEIVFAAVETAVNENVNPDALRDVAIMIVQTRVNGVVETSFEQSVEQAVVATEEAIAITATKAAVATAEAIAMTATAAPTVVPMPTATPTP